MAKRMLAVVVLVAALVCGGCFETSESGGGEDTSASDVSDTGSNGSDSSPGVCPGGGDPVRCCDSWGGYVTTGDCGSCPMMFQLCSEVRDDAGDTDDAGDAAAGDVDDAGPDAPDTGTDTGDARAADT